ncbi:AMP-binding protein [Chitinophaga pinensis]|uniref:AMP-binding protein n=1 Tax=Chitinophaga pinensis TaxID=79329 RepID=A0A5C6LTH1_9BACT|nr:AMP-binding protein [Chitinophaga pinensis]
MDNQLRQVPDGTVGEIFIGGVGVGVGYLNRPELNEERFMSDPFLLCRRPYV